MEKYGVPNTFFVRGVTKEPHKSLGPLLKKEQLVWFEPEPDNPYDPNAIAVMTTIDGKAEKVGYVPRELTPYMAGLVETTEDGDEVLYWGAHILKLKKDGDLGAVGAQILFYSNSAIPRQSSVTDRASSTK